MVRREELRLRALFRSVLVMSMTASAYGAAAACSSSSGSPGADGSGDGGSASDVTGGEAQDATGTNNDGSADGDSAASDGGVEASADAGPDVDPACAQGPVVVFEGGAPNDAGFFCEYGTYFPCGLPSYVTNLYPPTCNFGLSDCHTMCTGAAAGFKDCHVKVGDGCDDAGDFVAPDGGPIWVICGLCGGVGRRPAGLEQGRVARGRTPLGDHFAQAAFLEAAAVDAFRNLGVELAAHGAPRSLVTVAERCARDEVRHARVTARIARRHGGNPASPRRARNKKPRALSAIALENAVEGCVRETFGAMVATWQAANARDLEIAKAMKVIAVDETRHAAFSWAVARWAEAKLGPKARASVEAKKRQAIAELRWDVERALDSTVVREAGSPTPSDALRLLDALEAQLWS